MGNAIKSMKRMILGMIFPQKLDLLLGQNALGSVKLAKTIVWKMAAFSQETARAAIQNYHETDAASRAIQRYVLGAEISQLPDQDPWETHLDPPQQEAYPNPMGDWNAPREYPVPGAPGVGVFHKQMGHNARFPWRAWDKGFKGFVGNFESGARKFGRGLHKSFNKMDLAEVPVGVVLLPPPVGGVAPCSMCKAADEVLGELHRSQCSQCGMQLPQHMSTANAREARHPVLCIVCKHWRWRSMLGIGFSRSLAAVRAAALRNGISSPADDPVEQWLLLSSGTLLPEPAQAGTSRDTTLGRGFL
mmetsp:Transcript_56598/g.104760  ORF Transcript_56598/g.104760 Transcript_56598/m.104760 type:complete len:303 (+) Transcript_56598:100-1008(+)